jgi:hypothetical protein
MDALLRSLIAAIPDDPASFSTIVGSLSTETWPLFLEAAARHGVLGILSPYLQNGLVPEPLRESFARTEVVRSMLYGRLVQSLCDVVARFDAVNVPVCALKGPALAARLYGDPTARSSVDLDLLVSDDHFARAAAALRADGYSEGPSATAAYLRRHSHHLHFSKPGAVPIELHFVAYAGFGVAVPASALLDRAVPYTLPQAGRVLVPSPEDEFIYLAVHAAGHYFNKILWICDLKFLVATHPELDWDVIATRARENGVATIVGYVLKLLDQWLEMPLPDASKLFPSSSLRIAGADLLLPMASKALTRSRIDNLKGLVFTALLCDRVGSTLWMLQHHGFRSIRRRAQRTAPSMLPESWSG